jgi:hypothetical protein
MMGCSISQGPNTRGEGKVYKDNQLIGLFSGHAYGLLDTIRLRNFKLVRIRNPWGSDNPVEWNGPWSDNSNELIKNLEEINAMIKNKWKDEAELLEVENKDGSFLMEWDEFLGIWNNISICKKFQSHYEGLRFFGEWSDGKAGGTPTSNNPEIMKAYITNP